MKGKPTHITDSKLPRKLVDIPLKNVKLHDPRQATHRGRLRARG